MVTFCFYSTEVMISSQSCGLRGVSRDREKVPDAELRGELHPGLHAQVHQGPAGLGEEGVPAVQRESEESHSEERHLQGQSVGINIFLSSPS